MLFCEDSTVSDSQLVPVDNVLERQQIVGVETSLIKCKSERWFLVMNS